MSSTQTASYVGASGTVTDTVVTSTFNSFDGVGNLTQTSQTSTDNGVYSPKYPSTSETISYTWFGSAEENVVSYKPDTSKGTTWTTTYSDTPNGATLSAAVVDGMSHTNTYVTNAKGQIISRWMNYSPTAQQDLLYIFGGKMMGELSNDGTPADQLGAQQGVISATNVPSSNLWTNTTPVAYANMTESYDPVDPASVGNSSSTYMVVAGDTLQSIAQQQWGDSSLWYLIADANGIGDPNAALVAGTPLTLPAQVTNVHFNASTSQPYNANDALGNVSPTQAKPPGAQKCNVGQLIVMLIAVVVTAIVAPYLEDAIGGALNDAALSMMGGYDEVAQVAGLAQTLDTVTDVAGTMIGAGVAAAAGSTAGQLVGLATHVQKKFNWDAVGSAAVTAFVTAGVSMIPSLSGLGFAKNAFLTGVVRGAVAGAISNEIETATGLQKKFDWLGVATSAIESGITSGINQAYIDTPPKVPVGPAFVGLVSGGAAAIVGATIRSVVTGQDFGVSLTNEMPNVIGATIGATVTDAIQKANFNAYVDSKAKEFAATDAYKDQDSARSRDAAFIAGLADVSNGNPFGTAADRALSDAQVGKSLKGIVDMRADPSGLLSTSQRAEVVANYLRDVAQVSPEGISALMQIFDQHGITSNEGIPFKLIRRVDEFGNYVTDGPEPSYKTVKLGPFPIDDTAAGMLMATGHAAMAVAEKIQNNQWLNNGLTALMIAAGPLSAGLSLAVMNSPLGAMITRGIGKAVEAAGEPFVEAGYNGKQAASAAVGVVVVGGLAAAVVLPKVLGEMLEALEGAFPKVVSTLNKVAAAYAKADSVIMRQIGKLGGTAAKGADAASNTALHAKYLEVLRATEAANPLVESLRATGQLPANYVTKADAALAGWKSGKALENYVPGGQIGGDIFRNSPAVLPSAPGRVWYEADVGLTGTMARANQPGTRLLYSNDGQLFITTDHYVTVHPIGTWK